MSSNTETSSSGTTSLDGGGRPNTEGDPALLFRELFDETVMKGSTASDDGHIAAAAKEQELISAALERVWNLQEEEGPSDTLPHRCSSWSPILRARGGV